MYFRYNGRAHTLSSIPRPTPPRLLFACVTRSFGSAAQILCYIYSNSFTPSYSIRNGPIKYLFDNKVSWLAATYCLSSTRLIWQVLSANSAVVRTHIAVRFYCGVEGNGGGEIGRKRAGGVAFFLLLAWWMLLSDVLRTTRSTGQWRRSFRIFFYSSSCVLSHGKWTKRNGYKRTMERKKLRERHHLSEDIFNWISRQFTLNVKWIILRELGSHFCLLLVALLLRHGTDAVVRILCTVF